MLHPTTAYALDVVAGERIASQFVRRACQRHLEDLERADIVFDPIAASRAIMLARCWSHYKGSFAGKPFILAPWQEFIVGAIFGWKWTSTGLRRFRIAYVEVPRKNGKTFLAAHVGLVMMLADNEAGAEIYSLATKTDQAKLIWRDAYYMLKNTSSPKLRGRLSLPRNPEGQSCTIADLDNASKFVPLCSKYQSLDGLNPSCVVPDELHAWTDGQLWEVMEEALGARDQPLIFAITTAGYNRHGVCYQKRKHVLNILDPEQPEYDDDTWFGFVATVDQEDLDHADPDHLLKSETVWAKANPCLGAAKSLDYMRARCHSAMLQASTRNGVLNKQLNVWTDAASAWTDLTNWRACAAEFTPADLRGRRCFGGIDLAKVNDLSAFVLFFPPAAAGPAHVLAWFWCPEDDIERRQQKDHVPYRKWCDQGAIISTHGNVTDFKQLAPDIAKICEDFDVVDIGIDRHFSADVVDDLQTQGLEIVLFGQGFVSMSPPVNELERLLIGHEIRHNGNPVLTWMCKNAVVSLDASENKKFDKKKSEEKIDGMVALAMSIGRHLAVDESFVKTEGLEAW